MSNGLSFNFKIFFHPNKFRDEQKSHFCFRISISPNYLIHILVDTPSVGGTTTQNLFPNKIINEEK